MLSSGCSSAPRAINLVLNAGLPGCLLRFVFLGQTYLRSHGKGNLTPPAAQPGPLAATLKNSPRQGEPGSGYLLYAGSDLTLPPASWQLSHSGCWVPRPVGPFCSKLRASCNYPSRKRGKTREVGSLPGYLFPASWVGNLSLEVACPFVEDDRLSTGTRVLLDTGLVSWGMLRLG